MAYVDFVNLVHKKSTRNYLERVTAHDKAAVAAIATQFGQEYWDGERHLGYGGYRYDGRWRAVAEAMVAHYKLPRDAKILDVGCGKGFLLYDLKQVLPDATVVGIDISQYAIENAKEEIKPFVRVGNANRLPFAHKEFDFVYSINTLHNLYIYDLFAAVREIERVGKQAKHITVECYKTEAQKVNLMYWQLTCRAFHTPAEWEWIFEQCGYRGDYGTIEFD